MNYKISDYGANVNAGINVNDATGRGWGSGWPNCQTSKWVIVTNGSVRIPIRSEIAELVSTLFRATENTYGYKINGNDTHGAACRNIAGTNRPSNHSFGLAIDINASRNPYSSTFKTDIPPAVVRMWEECGFYWGGRYRSTKDTMHFEYVYKVSSIAGHLSKARAHLVIPPQIKLTSTPNIVVGQQAALSISWAAGSTKISGRVDIERKSGTSWLRVKSVNVSGGTAKTTTLPPADRTYRARATGVNGGFPLTVSNTTTTRVDNQVSSAGVIAQATSPTGKNNDVLIVQIALSKEVGLDYSSGPGIFGPRTRQAYSDWQKKLGFKGSVSEPGSDADGIPGRTTLTRLGERHGFKVNQ